MFSAMEKPRLNFWQMFNMSFGFLGIQFGWGLQLANMSAVYERLGARPDQVPLLWLAAPMTGLLVQPIVGALSDRTWGALGRRRPYFLTGAILASVALFFMPTSSSLWMAASLLWILDASINISMEPFRAFVGDMLDKEQHAPGQVWTFRHREVQGVGVVRQQPGAAGVGAGQGVQQQQLGVDAVQAQGSGLVQCLRQGGGCVGHSCGDGCWRLMGQRQRSI